MQEILVPFHSIELVPLFEPGCDRARPFWYQKGNFMPLVKFTVEDDQAALVKLLTRNVVASKAYEAAAHSALALTVDLADARQEIARLRRIIERQQQVLEGARSAAALLVEVAGQGDLFMERSNANV